MEKHIGHTMIYEGKGLFYCNNCERKIGRGVGKKEKQNKRGLNENILYVMGRADLAGGTLILMHDEREIKYALIDTGIGYLNYTKSKGYSYHQTKPYVGLEEIRVPTYDLEKSMQELQVRGVNAVLALQLGKIRDSYWGTKKNSVYFLKGYEQDFLVRCKDGVTRTIYKIGEGVMNVGPKSKEDNSTMDVQTGVLNGFATSAWVTGKDTLR